MASPLVFFGLQFLLLVLAVLLTVRASKEKGIGKKAITFVGVVVSTMPLIGFIQAAIFRTKQRLYSESCAYQAVGGITYYMLLNHVFNAV